MCKVNSYILVGHPISLIVEIQRQEVSTHNWPIQKCQINKSTNIKKLGGESFRFFGVSATIYSHQGIQCLPCAGFFFIALRDSPIENKYCVKVFEIPKGVL